MGARFDPSCRALLLVDDDPRVLDAFRRDLSERFPITCVGSAAEALEALEAGRFAVIMSDHKMPGTTGVELLGQVRRRWPFTTRVLLTGHADLEAASAAVNDGEVFRFLTKPIGHGALLAVLEQAVEQYRLRASERSLIEDTLRGTIEVLADVLNTVHPTVVPKAETLRGLMWLMVQRLGLEEPWRFEIAAMLSYLGSVAFPHDLLLEASNGRPLRDGERKLLAAHPAIAHRLLSKIPRLEEVAEMIRHQLDPAQVEVRDAASEDIAIGAQLLHLITDFERRSRGDITVPEVIDAMRASQPAHPPGLLETLAEALAAEHARTTRTVRVSELQPGDAPSCDMRTEHGVLIVRAGEALTPLMLERVRLFHEAPGIREPIEIFQAREGDHHERSHPPGR